MLEPRSAWSGLQVETEGVRRAARNLGDDFTALAEYVYDRCCSFTGAEHGHVSIRLISEAIDAFANRDTEAHE